MDLEIDIRKQKKAIAHLLKKENLSEEQFILCNIGGNPCFNYLSADLILVFDKMKEPSIGDITLVDFAGGLKIFYIAGVDFLGNPIYVYMDEQNQLRAKSTAIALSCKAKAIGFIDYRENGYEFFTLNFSNSLKAVIKH